jgi:hypothetical protein
MESYLMGTTNPTFARLRLRDLPLSARLVLSAFLLSVGLGYFAALVQLHMQHASPGNMLPTADDAERLFYGTKGERPKTKLEVLIEAEEAQPFNGSGQMRVAFTTKSTKPDWDSAIDDRAQKLAGDGNEPTDAQKEQAEKELRTERDGERLAVMAWVKSGAKKADYVNNSFALPKELIEQPLSPQYVLEGKKVGEERAVKLTSILNDRCFRCHKPDGVGKAKEFPLNDYAKLKPYVQASETSTRMSIDKLAQTTHVHLLGFSMLYGLTGLLFAFTSYPGLARAIIAPLPLVAQVVDISCWWLARLDPFFAHVIVCTGGIVAAGLMLQIVLTLFNLYGKAGKGLLLLLLVAGGLGVWQVKEQFIDPHLAVEKVNATAAEK